MPFSRSRSIESRTWLVIWRGSMACVSSSNRSASVDLPWSMWAMIEKLRSRAWGMVTRRQSSARSARLGREHRQERDAGRDQGDAGDLDSLDPLAEEQEAADGDDGRELRRHHGGNGN